MFGMRHSCGSPFPGKWAAGRGWRGHFRSGWGGRHGMGGNMMRAGRMLAQGDLRLIALALIAEQPRHGYEIIKAIDERSAGFYTPSPGMVYPALTYLEEIGYASVETEGTKKLYAITPEGRERLERNRSRVDTMLAQLRWIAGKMAHMREAFASHGEHQDAMTPELDEARARLRALLARKLGSSDAEQRRIADILRRATEEIEEG